MLATITVTPLLTTPNYAVEDAPPDGWTVSSIHENGQWENVTRKVKWGPFFDHNNRTLAYMVTPPPGETGMKTFSGTASFDGTNVAIVGDSTFWVCTVQQDMPDLTGEWTSFTQTCKRSKTGKKCKLTASFNVKNIGNKDALPSNVRFYLSAVGTYDTGDILLKQLSTGKLKKGRGKALKLSYSLALGIR
jgi:hypothetical protein